MNPVNTSLNEFIKNKFNIDIITSDKGVSIITCTNQENSLNNILKNFQRQNYPKKELIIIINNNEKISLKDWKEKIQDIENIRIYKIPEKISLGKCLNFGVEKSKYGIIAKFDDDDYYGPKYLSEIIKNFHISNADIVGNTFTIAYNLLMIIFYLLKI